MRIVQQEHKKWLFREFPDQPVWLPAAGMVEEAGELLGVIVKKNRIDLFGFDPRYKGRDWGAELVDAIGDCGIYCCSLCNTVGWDFEGIVNLATCEPSELTHVRLAAELVRCATDILVNPIRAYAICYISLLKALCYGLGFDFEDTVRTVWATVKERRRS